LDCWQAAGIVNAGKIDLSPLISQRFPLQEAGLALAAAENRKALKVALLP
jgi:threonine dehydrogenase-like Zn-dependent dehydrogenase